MKRHASKSFAIGVGLLALVVALVASVATSCSSGTTDNTGAPDTTVTSVDNSTTDDTATADTSADDAAAAAAAEAATLKLTATNNGKSYTVKVGDTISVVLAGNATTGYEWASAMPEVTSPLLTLSGGKATYVQDNVGTGVVGAGGTYIFVFTAAAKGQVELKLKYWRSFDAQAEPLQTFGATITIQ
jgi:inhibitor of cysteine peptidase